MEGAGVLMDTVTDKCEQHGVELAWYDGGGPESGPQEPRQECPMCRDEHEHPMIRCYMCVPSNQRGPGQELTWPERRTVKMSTINERFDATTAYHLECGHMVI